MSVGLPSLLHSFVADRLCRQQQASPHTIAGYRDSFRLLLRFEHSVYSIGDSLDDLEGRRKNSTRNIHLAAIHSFFQ